MEPLVIRPARPSDGNFVVNSWVQNQRESHIATAMTMPVWHDLYATRIKRYFDIALCSDSDVFLSVSCLVLSDEPDSIVGWVAHRPGYLDYVYVKGSREANARRLGHGTKLVDYASTCYGGSSLVSRSHASPRSDGFFAKLNIPFDPYSFMEACL